MGILPAFAGQQRVVVVAVGVLKTPDERAGQEAEQAVIDLVLVKPGPRDAALICKAAVEAVALGGVGLLGLRLCAF